MDFVTMVILISFGITGALVVICWVAWLFILHYHLRPNYLRGLMFSKDKKRKLIWLKKESLKGQIGTAVNKKYGEYQYETADVYQLGEFDAIDISPDSFKALSINQKNMQLDAQRSLHPKILLELLVNKFITELVETKKNIVEILMIIAILFIIGVGILVWVKTGEITDKMYFLEGNMNITRSMIEGFVRR